MSAQWPGYPPDVRNQTYLSLPSSPPPPYDLHARAHQHVDSLPGPPFRGPDVVQRVTQALPHGENGHYHEHEGPRAHTEHYRPTQAPNITAWTPYEPLELRHDELNYGEHNQTRRISMQNGLGSAQGQASYPWLTTSNTQVEIPSAAFPHMPGATRYMQERGNRNGQASSTAQSSVHDFNSHGAGSFEAHRAYQHLESGRVATVQTPRQVSVPSKSFANVNGAKGTDFERQSAKRPIKASSPPCGTQYAPLEISSSPEGDIKRRKTAKTAQTRRSESREPARPITYDGFSRQEITKILAESTNGRPEKIRYYAVAIGRKVGVYADWPSAEEQVHGFHGARHKKFKTLNDALAYVDKYKAYVKDAPAMLIPRPTAQRSLDPAYLDCEPYQPSLEQAQLLHQNSGFVSLHDTSTTGSDNRYISDLHDRGDIVVDDGPKLVPEQQHVVDLILQGRNVFYTGSAGCGKSTILKEFVKQLQNRGKRVRIVAPTNLAALNVGGQTTWNFAGWTPDSMKVRIDKLMENSRGKESWKKFDETDVLVIDEISMIENLQFERLNMILKASRGEKYGGGAFGGIQLIVTGDFYQLAPVKPFGRCMCGWELEKDNQHSPREYKCTNRNCREDVFYDIDKWAFRSNAWEECDFVHVNLTQIHRQSDMMFKSILNRIRTDGTILKPHAHVLLNHTSETEGAIEIYARRVDVDRVNNVNINKLPSVARAYKCLDNFDWPDHHRSDKTLERNTYRMPDGSLSALKEHRFEPRVQLKLKQRVVLQSNLDAAAGLVNGAQGTIIEFQDFDEKALPKVPTKKGEPGELRGDHAAYREAQIKEFAIANGQQPWPVVLFTNGITRTIFAECTVNVLGNEEPWCKLSRTQVPLAAGYAITVHKSQGMTLDRVTVDLARAFEPSQIYVALSRARSLKGLTVSALPRVDLGGANAQVKEFMENIVIKKKPGLTGAS